MKSYSANITVSCMLGDKNSAVGGAFIDNGLEIDPFLLKLSWPDLVGSIK